VDARDHPSQRGRCSCTQVRVIQSLPCSEDLYP
jgi:hypothetical protein